MTLIDHIQDAIASDDADTARSSERIVNAYTSATPETRAVLDDVFISLCGWSLSTLINEENDDE